MKWTKAKKGDKRIVSKFLLLPMSIGTDVRWLERVTIEEEYSGTGQGLCWRAIKFKHTII